MNPADKVAVVTGAASGLGLATVRALATAGSRIAAFDVNQERLGALNEELGEGCLGLVVDVTDEQAISAALSKVVDRFGSIDIAVNCAGVEGAAKTVSKGKAFPGSVAKIVKLEHAWRRLDGRNDDGFQVAPFPG